MTNNKSYNDLMKLTTLRDRFLYLACYSHIGVETFGTLRFLNQQLYLGDDWLEFRDKIIERDKGCELGLLDHPIFDSITVHHINPLSVEDVVTRSPAVFDPNNVITVSTTLHRAIHYGDESVLKIYTPTIRYENDTIPWRR